MIDHRTMTSSLWQRLRSDERGAILVLVAFAMVALIALMALTIDIGKQIRGTAQAQNAADAAALAAAGFLAGVPSDVAGLEDLARDEAQRYAEKNEVMGEPVTVSDEHVTFYRGKGRDSVEVDVHRDSQGEDGPLSAIFGGFFGIDELNVHRDAIAEVAAGGAGECMLPVGIMDLWSEGSSPENDEFDPDEDTYVPPRDSAGNTNPNSTGYGPSAIGETIVLWTDESPGTYNSSWWGPWVNKGATRGSAAYRDRIQDNDCDEDDRVSYNTDVDNEPGKMNSQQAAWTNLMEQGPDVHWNSNCGTNGCVVYTHSGDQWSAGDPVDGHPRIRNVPAYDPIELLENPGRKTVTVRNVLGVFVARWDHDYEIEVEQGNSGKTTTKTVSAVLGIITPAVGSEAVDGVDPDDSLIKVVRLVE